MKTVGLLLFVVGLCITLAQAKLYMEAGEWTKFTVGYFLRAEFDIRQIHSYSAWLDSTLTWLLEWECGPVLLVIGASVILARMAAQRFDDTQAAKTIQNVRGELLGTRRASNDR